MSKRSSPESDGGGGGGVAIGGETKRQRLVEFEPVRLPAVSGVVNVAFYRW